MSCRQAMLPWYELLTSRLWSNTFCAGKALSSRQQQGEQRALPAFQKLLESWDCKAGLSCMWTGWIMFSAGCYEVWVVTRVISLCRKGCWQPLQSRGRKRKQSNDLNVSAGDLDHKEIQGRGAEGEYIPPLTLPLSLSLSLSLSALTHLFISHFCTGVCVHMCAIYVAARR